MIIGGFGGLAAAKALRLAPVEVTLIDRQTHHLFHAALPRGDQDPLRWERLSAAAGHPSPSAQRAGGATEVSGVDLERRTVACTLPGHPSANAVAPESRDSPAGCSGWSSTSRFLTGFKNRVSAPFHWMISFVDGRVPNP